MATGYHWRMNKGRLLRALVFLGLVFVIGVGLDRMPNCPIKEQEELVSGSSLSGFIEHGQTVVAEYGYYACNPVASGDVVLYNHPGVEVPIIKIVKAVPGDQWRVVKVAGGTELIVNESVAKNSLGQPYVFTKATVLSLYEKDSGGIMPADSFIILGNQPGGTLDSTRFGFAHQNQLVARVRVD